MEKVLIKILGIVIFFVLLTKSTGVFAYDCDKVRMPTDYSTMSDNYHKGKRRCDPEGTKYNLEECKACCERIYYDRKQDRPDFCDILKDPPQKTTVTSPSKTASIPAATSTSATTNNKVAAELEARKKLQEEEDRTQQQIALMKKEKIKNEVAERKKEKESLLKSQETIIKNAKERRALVTFFIGPDYENIRQLRSEIVKNEALIQKIQNQLAEDIDEENKMALQGELQQLLNQQAVLQTTIAKNENAFSLFGWVFK